jgi:hypothetical protein
MNELGRDTEHDRREFPKPRGRFDWEDRQDQDGRESLLEFRVPAILFAVGFVAFLASAFALSGGAGALKFGVSLGLVLLVQIPVTIAGMYLLAVVLGISYGLLSSAILKLAAIAMCVAGLSMAGDALGHPILGRLALVPIFWYMFSLLFDLDAWETLMSLMGFCLLGTVLGQLMDRLVGVVVG